MTDYEKQLSYGYQPKDNVLNPTPPTEGSSVSKSCQHIYRHLGTRILRVEGQKYGKEVDVFYCEKCLDYKHK